MPGCIGKWYRQARQYINTWTRYLVENLYSAGVSRIYVGYPKNIAQNNGSFNTVNLWMYRYIINRLKYTAEEYGIEIVEIDEHATSATCQIHGKKDCAVRIKRGLTLCREINKVSNADLVGAFNILERGLTITPSPLKGDRGNGRETVPWGRFLPPNLPCP